MKKAYINFAIVGCGKIAGRHAEHITKLANLVAVCDIKKDRADEFSKEFRCKPFFAIKDLISDKDINVDVVSICTPNGIHAEQSIDALRAGIHVLVEKPMALKVKDCETMIKTAENSNRRLFVVKQNRFNPPIMALKKVIDEQRLGIIYSIQLNCFWNRNEEYYKLSDWKGTKKLDGGTLFTQFSHFIDLLYWLFGNIKDVQAYLRNYHHKGIIEFEDSGVIIINFESGIIGTVNYTINSYKKNMEGSITVFGEKGTVKVGGQYLNVLEYQSIKNYEIKDIPESGPANNYGSYQGSMSNHDKVYENVIDVFTNGGSITTNFLDGLKTVQIIEGIYNKGK